MKPCNFIRQCYTRLVRRPPRPSGTPPREWNFSPAVGGMIPLLWRGRGGFLTKHSSFRTGQLSRFTVFSKFILNYPVNPVKKRTCRSPAEHLHFSGCVDILLADACSAYQNMQLNFYAPGKNGNPYSIRVICVLDLELEDGLPITPIRNIARINPSLRFYCPSKLAIRRRIRWASFVSPAFSASSAARRKLPCRSGLPCKK